MLAGRYRHRQRRHPGASVLDPTEGVDATRACGRRRMIAQIGSVDHQEHRASKRRNDLPGFRSPVHIARMGARRGDDRDRHAAAAAGGYCAILAIPNTDPVVDDETCCRACAPATPRRPRSSRLHGCSDEGQTCGADREGALADAGAAGFTDDDVRSRRPGDERARQ